MTFLIKPCEENKVVHFFSITKEEIDSAATDSIIKELFDERGLAKVECLSSNYRVVKKMAILSQKVFAFSENHSDGCLAIYFNR